jgi:predicted nucleic acid-binding Zn ribbon protein
MSPRASVPPPPSDGGAEDRPQADLQSAGAVDDAGAPERDEEADVEAAAASALARARRGARDKGLRPGLKPLRRHRRDAGPQTRSGAGRDGRDPALVGEQLDRLMADRGWQLDVAAGAVMGRWPQIVGPDIAEHVTPVSFELGVLTLRADSTAWATQMRLMASAIIGRIDEEAGPGTVIELTVHGPSAPSWSKGLRRVKGQGPRDTYG